MARLFARVVGRPLLMRELTRVGMNSRTLMEWMLRISANLLREDEHGPAELAYRGGDFTADPAGPDHDNALGAPHGGDETGGVTPVAEVVDAVEVGSGAAQAARCGACGQQQPVVADALAGGELEPARVR